MRISATFSMTRALRWLGVVLAAVLLVAAVVGVAALRREAEQERRDVELLQSVQAESEALDRTRLEALAAGGDVALRLGQYTRLVNQVHVRLDSLPGNDLRNAHARLHGVFDNYADVGARQLALARDGHLAAARLIEVDEVEPAHRRLAATFSEVSGALTDHARRDGRLADGLALLALAAALLALAALFRRFVRLRQAGVRADREAIERSERRLRALVEHAYDFVGIVGPDARLTWVSESARRMLGYEASELVGTEFMSPVHPDDADRAAGLFAEFVEGLHDKYDLELQVINSSGEPRLIEAAITNRLSDPDVSGIVLNVRDVTELREGEDRLRQAQRLEAVGRLAGGVAHDFNNLLTVIIGSADVALARLPEGDAGRIELVEIRAASERAADLTRKLLAFGREQVLRPETFELDAAVVRTSRLFQRLIGENIEVVVLPGRGAQVRVDAGQLEQVLVNLALNARDSMPDGGTLTIATGTEHLAEPVAGDGAELPSGEYASLSVRDTGIGMDEETLERIFDPFFTIKHDGAGTGLGLATVHGIVAQSGGTITVESEPGHGSVFTVLLPLAEAAAGETPSRPALPLPSVRPAAATVLVAEDEPAVRGLVVAALERAGYTVLGASDGNEALALARRYEGPIDLLLTDVVMPGMSGRALAQRLTVERPGLPVLYTSGYPAGALDSEHVSAPGAGFLQKPFTLDELTAAVAEAIAADPLVA